MQNPFTIPYYFYISECFSLLSKKPTAEKSRLRISTADAPSWSALNQSPKIATTKHINATTIAVIVGMFLFIILVLTPNCEPNIYPNRYQGAQFKQVALVHYCGKLLRYGGELMLCIIVSW